MSNSVTISLRERRRQMLRDDITRAARALMLEKGYAAMSMDELAGRVGISKPTLYSHFATKEDLVVAGFIDEAERLLTFAVSNEPELSPRQRLVSILHVMLKSHAHEATVAARPFSPDVFHILCGNPQSFDYIQRMESLVGALFQEAITRGEIAANLNPKAMTLIFFSLAHAARTSQLFAARVDAETLEETFMTFFERGMAV